ncbi:MAG: Crp/Fnr family transcriptional regulator [Clostridiales bacterium]|nr:Crp/Fnr family transcriptional regulator [Clostridiales bacterium]
MTEQYLASLPFWGKLSETERKFVKRNSAIRRAGAGSLIYSRDCACVGMVYVVSGSLRIYVLSPEGREITLFRLGPGDPCVLSASCVVKQISFDTHMTADKDSELLVINAEAFAELTENNIWARSFLFELAAENFSAVMHTMESILFERFDKRLASFLIKEYERTGSRRIPMTQGRIAEEVNSAREVVARMLKQFAADGLVEPSRGAVTITDIDGLRAITE